MNPSDYRICLDVQAPHGAVELDAKQGDSERRIFITLTDGGVPYGITEDCRPLLTAKKPDGTVLYNLCRVEQNTAIYTLTRQTTACPGRVRCELRLYGSSFELDEEGKPSADSAQLLTAATFTLLVHSQVCSDEDAIASLPESTQLEQLVTDTQALLTHVQTKLEQGDFVGEKGDTGEKGEKGDRGEKGEKGEKGDPGQVNIDDDTISDTSTWSSSQISAEVGDCVGYNSQNKTESQKAQARKNIGALGQEITKPMYIVSNNSDGRDSVIITSKTIADNDDLLVDALNLQGNDDGHIDKDTVVLRGLHEGIEDTDAVNVKQLTDTELRMVDKLCPAFTESGAIVTCEPVEGYSLQVVSKINAAQEGEGDPTPNNIRPLVKHTAVQLSQSNGQEQLTYAFDFGRTVYGGALDWSTGILSIEWVIEEITKCTSVNYAGFANINTAKKYQYDGKGVYHKCSHYVAGKYASSYPNNYSYAANDNLIVMIDYTHFGTKESADAYLAAQKAAGTPVQICYKLTSPTKVQLTAQEVKALAGVNTIYSDTGDTTVTGKAAPQWVIDILTERISALEAALVNNV